MYYCLCRNYANFGKRREILENDPPLVGILFEVKECPFGTFKCPEMGFPDRGFRIMGGNVMITGCGEPNTTTVSQELSS